MIMSGTARFSTKVTYREKHKMVIPGTLPTLNEIVDAGKQHWGCYAKMKEEETNKVAWVAKQLPEMKAVRLSITYFCRDRRTDPDNLAAGKKFILDGLVKAGVLKNDGWEQVKSFQESWEVDKDEPRIEVILEDVSDSYS